MAFTTYYKGGLYTTTDLPFEGEYDYAFPVSDADEAEIRRGAELKIEDGQLVVIPLPQPEPEPVVIEGEFTVVEE